MSGTDFEESSGNVFADLGFGPAESEGLTAKSTLILAMKGAMIDRALTQKQAAKVCGTDQPTLSKVLHGRLESVTLDRLTHWLTALGQDVEITVRPAPATRDARVRVASTAATESGHMNAVITFFPVGNGDMTLISLESGRSLLVDMNIRQPGDDTRDVSADLRRRLKTDGSGRPYVDAVLLTHPDQDHCRGLVEHFHLGPLSDYKKPKSGELAKIVIREMWSSPIVFRRMPKDQTLCADAQAWATEARRRVNLYKAIRSFAAGDRIQVMGEDRNGKTDDITEIVVKAGNTITTIDGNTDTSFRGRLLAPKGQGTDEEEERRSKNHSSVIVRFSVAHGQTLHACRFLSGGDAEVAIWERIWTDHRADTSTIDYHLMQAPHHCSWHSLSYDSWGDLGEKVKVSPEARSALGQALSGAYIVATSKPIHNDKDDPPCIRAKREYEAILSPVKGTFLNTSIHGGEDNPVPMEFDVNADGPKLRVATKDAATPAKSLLRSSAAAAIPSGLGFPSRPVTPVKPAGFA